MLRRRGRRILRKWCGNMAKNGYAGGMYACVCTSTPGFGVGGWIRVGVRRMSSSGVVMRRCGMRLLAQ
jgi:hypothetical protein